jgi:hypothetical protein
VVRGELQDRFIHVGLRECARLLRVGQAFLRAYRRAAIRT